LFLPWPLLLLCLPSVVGIRAGLQPSVWRSRKAVYRSAEGWSEAPRGEATESIAFVFAVIFFRVFSPKIACQVPKPPKSFKQKEIELAC
jgi:hypothetical protein